MTFDDASKHFDKSWVNFVYFFGINHVFFGIFCPVIAFWCFPVCATKPLEIRAIQIGTDPGPLMSKPACNHSSRVSLANLATKTRMLEAGCFFQLKICRWYWIWLGFRYQYLIMLLNIMPTKRRVSHDMLWSAILPVKGALFAFSTWLLVEICLLVSVGPNAPKRLTHNQALGQNCNKLMIYIYMGISKDRGGPPKWMVKIMENPIF